MEGQIETQVNSDGEVEHRYQIEYFDLDGRRKRQIDVWALNRQHALAQLTSISFRPDTQVIGPVLSSEPAGDGFGDAK